MNIINQEAINEIPKGYKKCTKCHRIMPLTAFHYYKPKDKIKKHRAECIECERLRNALNRQKKLIENGPDYWNNYMNDYYHNRETLESRKQRLKRHKEYMKKLLEKDPDYCRRASKKSYYKHKNK